MFNAIYTLFTLLSEKKFQNCSPINIINVGPKLLAETEFLVLDESPGIIETLRFDQALKLLKCEKKWVKFSEKRK